MKKNNQEWQITSRQRRGMVLARKEFSSTGFFATETAEDRPWINFTASERLIEKDFNRDKKYGANLSDTKLNY